MKKFNRVLAMLLAIIMTLAVMPLSVFADAWLDTKVDTKKDGATESTTITVSLDAAALLNYLKSGDKAALTQGISLDALKEAFSGDVLGEIFPKANLDSIIADFAEEVDLELLMKYIRIDELLESANTTVLIEQIMALPNLQDYVLDYDALMGYISENDLASAIGYVNTTELIEDYANQLVPLALELNADVLVGLIDVDAVLDLLEAEGVDFTEVLNSSFFGTTLTYNDLLNFDGEDDGDAPDYMDMNAFIDFIHLSYSDDEFAHILHDYVDREQMKELLEDHEQELEPYLNMDKLQGMISGYADVKEYVTINQKLFNLVSAAIEADADKYINADKANDYFVELVESGEIDIDDLGGDIENINYANVFKSDIMSEAHYEALINAGALNMNALIVSAGAPLSIQTLKNEELFDLDRMLNEDDRFNIDALESAEVIDLNKMIFGDEAADLDPFDSDLLISYDVLDMHAMLAGDTEKGLVALFSVTELIRADVIHDEKIVEVYGYSAMIDNEKLKSKINALPNKGALVSCIKDRAVAIKTIGVKKAVNATCGSYEKLLNDYVSDVAGMMKALNVSGLINQINTDGKLNDIFNVTAIVEALGASELLKIVDVKLVVKQLSENDYKGIKEIAKTIDNDTYISTLTSILGVVEKNINEIKINDTVITKKDGDLLFIDTASLFVLLENIFPEIEDVANMGDDGKVFSTSLSIKYKSDVTGGVEKTKSVTVDFVLASGVDQARTAARKLKAVLDKFITWDFKDGIFSTNLRIPPMFAKAMRLALEKLAKTGNEDLDDLKDQLLTLFDLNVSEIGAFVDALTLEQVVALLRLVDSNKFSAAYNKLMTTQYVKTLLNYIKEATGKDFTYMTEADLLITATELPTLDKLCEKIEAKLGREIKEFDKIPAKDPVEILNSLAAKAGADVDLKQILTDAAATAHPLKTLYDTFVSIIENSEDAYANVKTRVLNVIDKILASNVANKFKDLSISDFYDENGVFRYGKKIEITPTLILEKLVNKAIDVVASKKEGLNKDLISRVANIFMSYFTDDTVTLGVDLTLRTEGLYKAVFYDENGKEIMTTLLPQGADLMLMKDYEPLNPEDVFLGWKALTSDTRYEKMPAKDIGLMADVGKLLITVVAPEDSTKLVGIIEVSANETLADHMQKLNALAKSWLKDSTIEDEEIIWVDVKTGADCDPDAIIEKNLYITWRLEIAHDVTIVNPENGETVLEYFNIPDGATLADKLEEMIAKVKEITGKDLDKDEILWINTKDGKVYDINAPITSDLELTWKLAEKVTVSIYAPDASATDDALVSFDLAKGEKISAEWIADLIALVKDIEGDLTLADEEIVWHTLIGVLFDIENTAIEENIALTWSLNLPESPLAFVTLADDAANELAVYVVSKGEMLNAVQIADMIERIKAAEGNDALTAEDIILMLARTGEIFAPETTAIEGDVTLTWALDSDDIAIVTLTDRDASVITSYVVAKGEKLSAAQIADMIEKVKVAENNNALTAQNIIWQLADGTAFDPALDTVDADMTLTWKLDAYTLTIVDPDATDMVVDTMTVLAGSTLADVLDQMNAIANNWLSTDHPAFAFEWFYIDGTAIDPEATIDDDLTVYWNVLDVVTVTVVDRNSTDTMSIQLLLGDALSAEQIAEILDWIKEKEGNDTLTLDDIIFKTVGGEDFAITSAIVEDVTLTWELVQAPVEETVTVTLVDRNSTDSTTYEVVVGESLSAAQIADILNWIKAKENNAALTLDDIIFKTVSGDTFVITSAIVADITLTWELVQAPVEETYTITLVDDENNVIWQKVDIAYGTAIDAILAEMAELDAVKNADPTNIMHVYNLEWREVTENGIVAFTWTTVTANHTLTWEYVEDQDKAAINIVGADRGEHYEIYDDANGNWIIEWVDADWPEVLELNISIEFYEAIAAERSLTVKSANSVHEFVYSGAILNRVAEFAKANPDLFDEVIETVSIHFELDEVHSEFDYADESGAYYFIIGFYFNGYDETDPNHHEQSIGMFGANDVKITLPFANASMTGDKVTFVTFAGKDENGTPLQLEDVALSGFNTEKGSVTFYAPHFSGGAIVNKYAVYHAGQPDASRLPATFPTEMIPEENIATFPIASGNYFAQGELLGGAKHPFDSIDLLGGIKGFYVAEVKVYNGNTASGESVVLRENFTMPGNAITLQHVIDIQLYYIYYYVNSALSAVDSYTILEELPALRAIPAEFGSDWKWIGYEAINPSVAPKDMYVYLVNDTAPDAEKQFTVNFYDATDKLVESVTKSVAEWAELWSFPTVASKIPGNAAVAGYWVIKDASTEKKLLDLTVDAWYVLLEGTELNVYARYTDREYTVYTDGNATVDRITATVGTTIAVTLREEIGKKVTVVIHNLSDPTSKIEFVFDTNSKTSGTFVMPASDVEIEVVYAAEKIDYVDASGKNQTANYGDLITLPAISIPEGNTIDMGVFATVADELILVSSSMDANRNLVLVYQYVLVESVNEQELIAAVKNVALNYQLVYVLNGKTFAAEDAALAALTTNATFKEWCANGKNLKLASLNLASENLEPTFLILCIVLIVLILILLIALFYILYITGKLKPNWFLKAITAIVSAFFVVCMAVAKAGLAIARLFGYREEDLVETSEEINARIGEAEATEEVAEEVTEEATEEVTEEATEEVTEEVTEEAAEEATEEVTEEATEEATEETTEEVAEETTEEVAEDAETAAAVEEAIAVVVEEATEEADAEATDKENN